MLLALSRLHLRGFDEVGGQAIESTVRLLSCRLTKRIRAMSVVTWALAD
ncbi:hypothetical protein [Mesorhizobium sp. M0118]